MKNASLLTALSCAVCLGLAACASSQAADRPLDSEGVAIAGEHTAVFTAPPRKIPSDSSTDAPLLGNGDFLAALGGPPHRLEFFLSKNDLWDLRPNGSPRMLGKLRLDIPLMQGASYRVTQDLRHATTTGAFQKGAITLAVESVVAATENTMWITLSAVGGPIQGTVGLGGSETSSVPDTIADNGKPATIGREMHGNGRYHFDGDIADVRIGKDPVTKPDTGQPAKPESFDGKTTFRELAVAPMGKSVGVSAWIRINRVGDANYIVSKGEWNRAYSLGLAGGRLRWAVNGTMIESEKPLETGKWLPIAASFDGKAMRLFVGGKQVASLGGETAAATQVIERRFEQGMAHTTGAACAARILGGKDNAFTVVPGKPVTLVVTATGLANTRDYRADAIRRADAATGATLAALKKGHDAWWADFWAKSFVEVPDKVLEQRYCLSHYGLASASRLPHFAPGLYGWIATPGTPGWGGAYFTNYNLYAPFYGLYAGNRIEQVQPCNDAVINSLPLGLAWAKDEAAHERFHANNIRIKDAPGILLPVSLLPLGIEGAPTAWGQRSGAAYACVPLASTWYATYDLGFAKKAWPFVRETAVFWEHYLVKEGDRYVDRNDAVLENSGQDLNPLHTLALIRQVMDLACEMSQTLGQDADQRAKWRDIREHLADYPTCTVGDLPPGCRIAVPRTPENLRLPIFRYSERGTAWQNDNAVGIQHIFPGNGIGLGSNPALLERARNQIAVMGRWIDLNGCNSFYPAAARVGYDPKVILKNLRYWVDTASPNGMRADNPHGMEQFSVVPCTLQEMLMQSHEGVIRLFPAWPKEMDARFGTLRARGAFLVSAQLKGGEVSGVEIRSEKGRDCAVVNPWPGEKVKITRDGKAAETVEGERIILKTKAGEVLTLAPGTAGVHARNPN